MTSTRYFRDIYYAKYYGKGGGEWSAGGKKLGVRGKNAKVERKKEENYIKKGEKGLKNAWAINSKKIAGVSSNPPCTPGGGGMIRMHNIYPLDVLKKKSPVIIKLI